MKLLVSLVMCCQVMCDAGLFPRRGLELVLGVARGARAPLALVRRLLRRVVSSDLSRSASRGVGQVLKCADRVVDYCRGVTMFSSGRGRLRPNSSPVRFRLCAFVASVIGRYQTCTSAHRVGLGVGGSFDCVDYQISRVAVATTLRYLLGGVVRTAPYGNYVGVSISRDVGR